MSKLTGVILAGGEGTRLKELTKMGEINKHLVPVNGIPMIEYPLTTLRKMGVENFVVVTGAKHLTGISTYLEGKHPEINFTYKAQAEAGGIPQAIGLAENVVGNSRFAVILGDNIFEEDFSEEFKHFQKSNYGARIYLKKVSDPERSGVVEIKYGRIVSIEEKPPEPRSDLIAVGLYFFDKTVFEKIPKLEPSPRGELEVVELLKMYHVDHNLDHRTLNSFWNDAGTPESIKEIETYLRGRDN